MLMRIVAERKRREIHPTIVALGELTARLADDTSAPPPARERIARMHDFRGPLSGWYDQVRVPPKPTLVMLMKLGGKAAS